MTLNISNSITFLTSAREALCYIMESSHISNNKIDSMKSFIMNEATDYQDRKSVV